MTITYPYWNNDEVISSDKLNSMVQAIINGDPLAVKVSNATKNDVNQIVGYLSSLHDKAKTNLNSATSTNDLDTAYANMTALVSNKLGAYANDDTVDLYSTGIRASIIAFLQAYDTMMSNDRLNNKNTDNTLGSRIDSETHDRETADNEINTKISDMQANGGGRNLLIGTSTASGDVAQTEGDNSSVVNGAFSGYDAVKTNKAWSERCINLKSALGRANVKAGDWITISVYVKADKPITDGGLCAYRVNGGHLDSINMSDRPITTQWQQYSWSYQINNDSLTSENTRIEYSQDTGDNWIYWAGWVLERGRVAHDWTPAPEDLDSKVDTKINTITSNGGGRNLWVNSKSLQNTYINVPQVYYNTDSDGIVVAHITGSNFGSGFYSDGGWIYANSTEPFAIGDSETFSVEMKGTGTITIGREHDFEKAVTLTDTWTRYSVSGEVKTANRAHIMYNESGKDCDSYVRLPMVERGLVAHDWQPALEDVDATINTSVNSKISIITNNGGGRNLLLGTRDFNTKSLLSSRDKVAITNGQETFQAITGTQGSDTSYYDIIVFFALPLEKDTDYTASFWAKTSEDIDIWSYLFDSGSDGKYADGGVKNHVTTDYHRFVVHFHNGNNSATPSFVPARIQKAGVTIWLYGLMLEKGTVAHDWSPAPGDFDTYASGRTINLPNNSSITLKNDRIVFQAYLPMYFTDHTPITNLDYLADHGEWDNLFVPSATMATLTSRPTNPDTNASLTGDCFFSNHYAYSGTTIRAFQKIYSCDYNYVFIRSYNGSSKAWTNWSCLTPYA